jgi:thioredoxin reductase (NADPH)
MRGSFVKVIYMSEPTIFAPKPKEGEPWDVIIIGSGPASLTAAIYTTRGAASTLVLGGEKWGGQLMLTTTIENFPGFPEGVDGPTLMKNMKMQAERFGAEFVEKNVETVAFDGRPFQVTADGKTYTGKSLIIATGADTTWLNVPGEQKLIGRGVSSCAPCDAPFFKDKKVAVIGGGDAAMEEVVVLSKYTDTLFLIHRRDELRASAAMQTRIFALEKAGKLTIIWDTEVPEFIGDQKLESLVLKTNVNTSHGSYLKSEGIAKLGGEIKEEKDGNILWNFKLDGAFVAIGHTPATHPFLGKVAMDEKGYIEKMPNDKEQMTNGGNHTHYNSETNVAGVFVAGDVQDYTYRQAITAAGFGCQAGLDVLKFLDKDDMVWSN